VGCRGQGKTVRSNLVRSSRLEENYKDKGKEWSKRDKTQGARTPKRFLILKILSKIVVINAFTNYGAESTERSLDFQLKWTITEQISSSLLSCFFKLIESLFQFSSP